MTENPIVVGVDGSPEGREALRWASRMADSWRRPIIAVHALGLLEALGGQQMAADRHRTEVEETMRRDWCSTMRIDTPDVRAVVRDGDAIDVLLDLAVETNAELLVIGTRGAGAAPALTLGSTALHLVQESPVPVLVVPDPERATRHLALRRILVAIDGTPASEAAVDRAADLAARFDAQVELVRAIEEVPVFPLGPATTARTAQEADTTAQARRDGETYCEQVRDHGVLVHLTVERGTPAEVVRQIAARLDADLIVAATHRAGDVGEDLLASVSRRIVHVAHRPTLVVPVGAQVDREAARGRSALDPLRAVS